jgi:hypothetical protein
MSGKPTVVLAYPVRHDENGDVVGVLALGINLTEMQTLFPRTFRCRKGRWSR